MVEYVAPLAHTKSEHPGSTVAVGGLTPIPERQTYSVGLTMNDSGNRADGPRVVQVTSSTLPPVLTLPKPEPQLYRKPEGETADYDIYMHGRKRTKLHDTGSSPVLQSSCRFPSATFEHGSGGGSPLPTRYPQLSILRKSSPMLPPTPLSVAQAPCNPLEEPSPLGLTLKKTPSLLDLISFQLQHSSAAQAAESENSAQGFGKSKIGKCLAPTGSTAQDKLKASNFPASTLKIGTWERASRYEGDLVAKCYYAKRKLVWEVLDSGLKSKIEIQWSDISAMKATCPDNLPGSLEIEISRPPLFFKETNPQPRKHTLWQATTDFTGGQASICKVHYLQFPEGVLNRHYEKLVQCDPRLKALVDGTLSGSGPRYDSSDSAVEGQAVLQHTKPRNAMVHVYDAFNNRPDSPLSPYPHLQTRTGYPSVAPELDSDVLNRSNETSSPSSVMEVRRRDEGGDSDSGEFYGDLGSYSPYPVDSGHSTAIGYDLQDMKSSMNLYSGNAGVSAANRQFLDEIAHLLLGDSSVSLSNEQAILLAARVGSMQAAIARDFQAGPLSQPAFDGFSVLNEIPGYYTTNPERSVGTDNGQADSNFDTNSRLSKCINMLEPSFNSVSQCLNKNPSTGELLMNLPRVASLPQLFESVSQGPMSRFMGIQ